MEIDDDKLKDGCADILSGIIYTLSDILVRKGVKRKKAILMAGEIINKSAYSIALELSIMADG